MSTYRAELFSVQIYTRLVEFDTSTECIFAIRNLKLTKITFECLIVRQKYESLAGPEGRRGVLGFLSLYNDRLV